MESSWEIVEDSPYFKGWLTNGLLEQSPDKELKENQSLITLRATSHKLIKNNFMAIMAQQCHVNTLMGGKLKLRIFCDNKKLKKQCTDLLTEYKKYDICREYTLSQIVEQIITASFEDGDILINLPIDKRYKGTVQTYVELINASRIKTPPKHTTNPLIREGVEYYSSGRLKGYHVITAKSQDKHITYYTAQDKDFEFYPVYKSDGVITRKVCHLFKAPLNLSPRQSRQVPVLTGIMGLLRYVNQYLEAVLVGSRVAACFAAFIKTKNKAAARKSLSEPGSDVSVKAKQKRITKLQPGLISYLYEDEEITFGTPNRPSDNADTFMIRLARFVAATIRFPYEHMFLDLSVTSYSSWRGGSLEVERNVNRWKCSLEDVIEWIVLTRLGEGVAKRKIKGSLKDITLVVAFPKYKSIDEEKSSRARKINLTDKSTSHQREQEELGYEYDQLQEELDEHVLRETEREALVLKLKKELSEKYNIIFPESPEEKELEDKEDGEDRDTSGSRREGEETGEDLSEEDKDERRKSDGNWNKKILNR